MKGKTLGAFIKLIVFAVVTILATALLTVVIENRSFGATYTYSAYFTNATGLYSGDQVKIAGVRVGTVTDVNIVHITWHNKPMSAAEVTFTVARNDPVYASDRINIDYLNLVGQRYLALSEHSGPATTQPKGVPFGLDHTAPSLDLTSLFDGFRPLFSALNPKAVNSFTLELIRTLQGEGGTIDQLVEKSAQLTNSVANHDALIGQVIDNLLTTLQTVQAHTAGLNQLIDQLQRLVTGLANNRHAIAASLTNIDNLARNSATLLSQIRPALTPDIRDVSRIANSINTTKTCPGYFDNDGLLTNPELRAYLQKHGLFAPNNCKGPNTLEEFLKREPDKIAQITRTATYGSFFNFWACDLNLRGSNLAITFNSPACGAS